MGKTDTVRERAVYIHLPPLEMAEDWKQRAGNAHVSVSKFVLEHVRGKGLGQILSERWRARMNPREAHSGQRVLRLALDELRASSLNGPDLS